MTTRRLKEMSGDKVVDRTFDSYYTLTRPIRKRGSGQFLGQTTR